MQNLSSRSLLLWTGVAALVTIVALGCWVTYAQKESLRKPRPPLSSEARLTITEKLAAQVISKAYAQETLPDTKKPTEALMGWFKVSRYYTPVPGQARYLNGWKKGKEGQCAIKNLTWMPSSGGSFSAEACINGSGDLHITADGTDLTNVKPYTVVACSKWMLGYRLRIEGFGEVICRDTGGAIKNARLDIWIGMGDEGFTNYINGDSIPSRVRVYRLL